MSGTTPRDWGPVLSLLNSLVLSSGQLKGDLTTEMLSTRWCGASPATAEQIVEAEKRLGVMLPPSYRAFLSATNGWPLFDSLVERLLPVEQIEWLRYADPTTLSSIQGMEEDDIPDQEYLDYDNEQHVEAIRPQYYSECLLVGKGWESESEKILLNSQITFPDGEWETIFFASWVPGNRRYRSFYDWASEYVRRMVDRVKAVD